MANRTRKKLLICYFSEEEAESVREKMHSAGYASFSAYARAMLLNGKVNQVDLTELKPLTKELGNLNRNLNQIAKVANTTRDLHEQDYLDVLESWRQARMQINRYLHDIIRTQGEAYLNRSAKNGRHKD